MTDLLLIDGSNLLFQMFFGMPARISSPDGRPIQGTLGFVGALLQMIRMTAPQRMAVFFDGEQPSFRSTLDPAYKAGRADYTNLPPEETPFSQLPDIKAALDRLGIRHAETCGCEVDDWLAGYALTYGTEHTVTLASQDSDLFQLITPSVSVLRYRGRNTVCLRPEDIRSRFGISPGQYADFKAMVGDRSDNLRGAAGVGPKTAAVLLNEFGSLEAILSDTARIARQTIRDSLTQHATVLRQNAALIRLNADAALPFPPEMLAFTDPGYTTREVLAALGLR